MKKSLKFALVLGLLIGIGSLGARGEEMAIKDGSKVFFDYNLTVDGEVIDSSDGRTPLEYIQGQNQIVPGLEKALLGLKAGDEKTVTVSPEEGYGLIDPEALREVPKTSLPPELELQVGMVLGMQGPSGRPLPVKVSEIKDESVIMDFNHPLAGKELNFKVKVVSVE
ncbi:MAG: peptidylprolyl isomerase [Candidatus Omnitrophica bacterium]|nr:peptidylprolyl isomerase [Candidatus Omnitrophota bacterium]